MEYYFSVNRVFSKAVSNSTLLYSIQLDENLHTICYRPHRRMGEDTVFSLFVSPHLDGGGGTPICQWEEYPLTRSGWGWGYPFPGLDGDGGTPSQVWMGGYPFPGLDGGGYPFPGQEGGLPILTWDLNGGGVPPTGTA